MDMISGISYATNTTTINTLAEEVAEITGNSVESVIEALRRIAQPWAWRCSDSRLEDLELCVPEKEPELLISKDELDAALDELLAPVMGGAA